MATMGSSSVAAWILFARMSWSMDAVPVLFAPQPPSQPSSEATAEVRDFARLFSGGAGQRARSALERIRHSLRIPVRLETVESLDGAWVADVAGQRARAVDPEQLYILVAGNERDVGLIAARHGPASRLTAQQRETIRRSFLGPLQAGETDGALEQGVRTIGTMLVASAPHQRGTARDAFLSVAVLSAALAAFLALRYWVRHGGRRRRRRRTLAGKAGHGHADEVTYSNSPTPRVPRFTPAGATGGPAVPPDLRRDAARRGGLRWTSSGSGSASMPSRSRCWRSTWAWSPGAASNRSASAWRTETVTARR
jgi:uncharacterized membrane protein YgcG